MTPMLAKPYVNQPIAGWLVSEKLDGVRAIWTGSEFVSRNGNTFSAPGWFTERLPKGVVLDGELFMGRGKFQQTVGAVRCKTPDDTAWAQIRFMVFDAPDVSGGFEARLQAAAVALNACPYASVVDQTPCRNKQHLDQIFAHLTAQGAEGVMLREPGSAYEQKRSNSLLKYKPYESDEAVVIGRADGEGRLTGLLGALVCRWRDKVFNVGSGISDDLREAPPAIGSIVTFCFCGLTDGGIPRFPSFLAVRNYE